MIASIIITSYNNQHALRDCIESALNSFKDDCEVIVADSGSTDGSTQIIGRLLADYPQKLHCLFHSAAKPLSPAAARNKAASIAKGTWLIFTDADCIVPANWVDAMIQSAEDYGAQGVIGSRFSDEGGGFGTKIRAYDYFVYSHKLSYVRPLLMQGLSGEYKKGGPVLLAMNNAAILRKAWEKLGGMRESLFHKPVGEDIDLQNRLLVAGMKLVFAPQIRVRHIHPLGMGYYFRKAYYGGRAAWQVDRDAQGQMGWRELVQRGRMYNPFFLGLAGGCFFLVCVYLTIGVRYGGAILYLILILILMRWFNIMRALIQGAMREGRGLRRHLALIMLMPLFDLAHSLARVISTGRFVHSKSLSPTDG